MNDLRDRIEARGQGFKPSLRQWLAFPRNLRPRYLSSLQLFIEARDRHVRAGPYYDRPKPQIIANQFGGLVDHESGVLDE